MKQLILTQFPWPWLPTLALVIFVTFFVLTIVRVSRKSHRPVLEASAQLALEEGEKNEQQ